MTNSLIIFIAALLFIVFGYVSVVRIAYRHYFSAGNAIESEVRSYLINLINGIGHGAVFTCLAASSLLLFWGWGLALLWLIAFHLIAETVFNMQLSSAHLRVKDEQALSETSAFKKTIIQIIWSIYALITSAIVVALLVNLINQQTGLVFALIALLPAHMLLRDAETGGVTRFGIAISLVALLLGLLFSHQLGISIYGSFNPIENLGYPELANDIFAWLRFDNTSIITIALIISGLVLSGQTKFRSDLSSLTGFLVVITIIVLVIKLAWLRPLVDAPLNSTQSREPGLPAYSSLAFFLFTGLSLLLLRENKDDQKKIVYKKITDGLDGKDDPAPSNFVNLQLTSLGLLVFSIVILLALACALGIGAWNTHYVDWNNVGSLATHFNLAITSILTLLNETADSGSITYSLFIAGLSFAGFALFLNVTAKLSSSMTANKEQTNSIINQLQKSNIVPAIIIYLISNYLIQNGISIDLWIIVGMLAWLLVTNIIVDNTLAYQGDKHSDNRNQIAQSIVSMIFIVFGSLQTILTALRWANNQQWGFTIVAIIILLIALLIWKNQITPLIRASETDKSPELFS